MLCTVTNRITFPSIYFSMTFFMFTKRRIFYLLSAKSGRTAHAGFDVVVEDVNLLSGDFKHKRQNLGQAIQQSNLTESFLKQHSNIDNNLYFNRNHFEKSFKDDRENKTRLIRVMLNFKLFHCHDRNFGNEFERCTDKSYNSKILKRNW